MRLLTFFLFLPTFLLAQDFVDLVELDYRISPDIPLTIDEQSKADIEDIHARLLFPYVVDSSRTILLSLAYDGLNISPYRLHAITGLFGIDQHLNKKYKALALLIPKISADLMSFSSKDIQLGGIAILSKTIKENLSWKFGVYGNADRFGPLVVPIIGFKWQANSSWRIESSLPISAHIRKTISSRFITGIKYSGRKYSYNLSEEDAYIEVGDNHVWAYADFYIAPTWVLHLRAGHSVLRNFARYSNSEKIDASMGPVNFGDERPIPDYERKNGPSLQVGLRYRYAIKEK